MNLYSAVQVCRGTRWRFRRPHWHVGTTVGVSPHGRLFFRYAEACGIPEHVARWAPADTDVLADDYEVTE